MSAPSTTIHRINERLTQSAIQARIQIVALTGITVLAATLRFYRLGDWSFWIDEIFTINRAALHVNLKTIIAEWWHPSLSLILTNSALETLGVSEWSARLVPALIGIISVPVLYFPIKRLFGSTVALISVLLLAVSPWHLEWSQNARFYTSLLLLYFFAAYAFFQAIEQDRPRYLMLSAVLLVLAIGERFQAVFLVPVVLSYLLLIALLPFERPTGFRNRNLALILVPGVSFALVEVVRFVSTGSSYIMGAMALTYNQPIDDPFRLATLIGYDIGIPLVCLALFAALFLLIQRSRTGLFITLSAVVPVIMLLSINPFMFTKDRYVFMTLPFWIILAAVAVREIYLQARDQQKIIAVGVLFLLLADAAGDSLLYFQVNNGNRHDWKGAFALVNEQSLEGDQVVSWWPQFGPYYLDKEITPWADVDPRFVSNSGARVWFILDEETVWGNAVMKAWVEQNAELIDLHYLRRPDDVHLRVYLYDPF